jgi:ATP-dependent Clp protease, protease subunit
VFARSSPPRSRTASRRPSVVEVKALATGSGAEIDVYGAVDPYMPGGISAASIRAALKDISGPVTLRMNSEGGDVFDGVAIYNDLVSHGCERVVITGLAGSISSLIAMARQRVEIAANAFMMIHNSWAEACGDHQVFGDMQAMLRQIDGQMAATYAARCKRPVDEIAAMMDAETWLTAQEAVDLGLCDAIYGGPLAERETLAAARVDASLYRRPPEAVKAASARPLPGRDADVRRAAGRWAASALADTLASRDRRDAEFHDRVAAALDRLLSA